MEIHYLIVLIVAPLVLIGIGYMYIVESNWYEDDDFEFDDDDEIIWDTDSN